nr:MAG TPA: hypothetical protein [Inoviridae sp.]
MVLFIKNKHSCTRCDVVPGDGLFKRTECENALSEAGEGANGEGKDNVILVFVYRCGLRKNIMLTKKADSVLMIISFVQRLKYLVLALGGSTKGKERQNIFIYSIVSKWVIGRKYRMYR